MAISIVGTPQQSGVTNGADVTLTFDGTPQEGDYVVVFGGHPYRAATNLGPSTGGYTLIAKHDASAPMFGAWYKKLGASPDATVVCYGSGDAADGTAYCCYVLRGVDPTTIEDVTSTVAGPTNGSNPNNASIDPTTNDCLILALAGSQVSDAAFSATGGYSNLISANGNDTNDISVGGATKQLSGHAAEDPAAFTSWTGGFWYAITVAVRPAAVQSPKYSGGFSPAKRMCHLGF